MLHMLRRTPTLHKPSNPNNFWQISVWLGDDEGVFLQKAQLPDAVAHFCPSAPNLVMQKVGETAGRAGVQISVGVTPENSQ